MDSPGQTWFQMASRRMEWLASRQTVIAQNIANADTPGYVGQDVQSFEDYLKADPAAGGGVVERVSGGWGGSKDGNTVVLEEQAVLSAQTAGEFRLASRLYAKGYQLVALAVGRK
ncbi:MAG TPA: flagellar basal body protein [Tabrizicola sp.]|jgi:flagellar basal-body rod protein FlgB